MVGIMGRKNILEASLSFDYKAERVHLMLDIILLKIRWYDIKNKEV